MPSLSGFVLRGELLPRSPVPGIAVILFLCGKTGKVNRESSQLPKAPTLSASRSARRCRSPRADSGRSWCYRP